MFGRNNSVASSDYNEDFNDTNNEEMEMVSPQPPTGVDHDSEDRLVTMQQRKKYELLRKHKFWRVVSAKPDPTDKRPKQVHIRFSCMICANMIVQCSSDTTGNLLKHVRRWHPARLTEYQDLKSNSHKPSSGESGDSMIQPRIGQLDMLKKNGGGKNRTPLTVTQQQLDDAIVNFIVKDGQAFNVVNGAGFQEFVRTVCPGRRIMSRQTATRRVNEDFDMLKKRMVEIFKTIDNLAISVDGWSKNSKGFMGYTVTWIDDNLERHTLALACKRLEGSHTWDVLAAHIENTLRDFSIYNKTTMCTTDGASNFKKAFDKYGEESLALKAYTQDLDLGGDDEDEDEFGYLLEGYIKEVEEADVQDDGDNDDEEEGGEINPINLGEEFDRAQHAGQLDETKLPYRIRCATHNLNLVAGKDSAEAEVNKKYSQVKKRFMDKVEHIWKRQGTSSHDAETIVKHVGVRLPRPNKTRWNAYYDCLTFLKGKIDHSDDKLRGLLDELGQRHFGEEELLFLEEWLNLQAPIAEALDALQGDVGLGYALPTVFGVQQCLE